MSLGLGQGIFSLSPRILTPRIASTTADGSALKRVSGYLVETSLSSPFFHIFPLLYFRKDI